MLKPRQQLQLIEAIADHYDYHELKLVVMRANEDLNQIAGQGLAIPQLATEVVENARRRMWTKALLDALHTELPQQPDFTELRSAFTQQPDAGAVDTELADDLKVELAQERDALQGFIENHGGFLDLANLAQISNRVCLIRYKTPAGDLVNGTGFLLGPDVLMTNYHVMKDVLDRGNHADVKVRFDYQLLPDGITTTKGTYCALAANPILDFSTLDPRDLVSSPAPPDVPADRLDYCLLQLDTKVGCQDLASGQQRGWFKIQQRPILPEPDDPLLVVQHPAGEPVKIAHLAPSVITRNGTNTRVRHRTPTLKGSSGAPCFDANFNLVGLHASTDPQKPPKYNQMIPIRAIRTRLDQTDHLNRLDQPCE